jgi:predicted transcriptional regulator
MKLDEGGREISDAVSYAIGHQVRIEILVILNVGAKSPAELARLLHKPLSTVQHHVAELAKSGSIEEAGEQRNGNIVGHLYRAMRRWEYTAEEMAEMSEESQRATVGIALQNAAAEHLAAFREGAMDGSDPDLVLSWNWFNVDEEGKAEIARELADSWRRLQEIETRSAARSEQTKEEPRSVIVSSIAHPRVRPAPGARPFDSLISQDD